VDIVIESSSFTVIKILLHANNPRMPNFCVYDRCFFEIDLKREKRLTKEEIASKKVIDLDREDDSDEMSTIVLQKPALADSTTEALENHLRKMREVNEEQDPSKKPVEEELKVEQEERKPDPSNLDKDKNEESSEEYEIEQDTITIDPLTNFSEVFTFLSGDTKAEEWQYNKRDYPHCGSFHTRYYAFKMGLIFEVIPELEPEEEEQLLGFSF